MAESFTAFLDESGTHGPRSLATVMGGFVGTLVQWEQFEKDFKRIQEAFPSAGVLHGKEFYKKRKRSGPPWADAEYEAYFHALLDAMIAVRIQGVVCCVTNRDYTAIRERWRQLKTRVRLDSIYGLCFRGCMTKLSSLVRRHYPGARVSFVVESGHKNVGDAKRIFDLTKSSINNPYPLGNLIPASKAEYGALQIADLLAYGTHVQMQQFLSTGDRVVKNEVYAAIATNIPNAVELWMIGQDINLLLNLGFSVEATNKHLGRRRVKPQVSGDAQ